MGYAPGITDGIFDEDLRLAVAAYQNDNWEEILKPWGINPGAGTGWLYQSTRAHMNLASGCDVCVKLDNGQKIGCDDEVVPTEPAVCTPFTTLLHKGIESSQVEAMQKS